MNKAIAMISQLKKKQEMLNRTVERLERSVRITQLWPAAFKCGPVKVGMNKEFKQASMKLQIVDIERSKLIISRSDGEHREYSLIDSPIELWEETFNNLDPLATRCLITRKR